MISELIPLEKLTDHTAPSQYPPPPPPPNPGIEMDTSSQPLGKLAQGLSLTMTPTKTARPLWKLSPQSPGFCTNILGFLGARFKKIGYIHLKKWEIKRVNSQSRAILPFRNISAKTWYSSVSRIHERMQILNDFFFFFFWGYTIKKSQEIIRRFESTKSIVDRIVANNRWDLCYNKNNC